MQNLDEFLTSLMEEQSKVEAELEKIEKAIQSVGDLKSEQIARGFRQPTEPAYLFRENG